MDPPARIQEPQGGSFTTSITDGNSTTSQVRNNRNVSQSLSTRYEHRHSNNQPVTHFPATPSFAQSLTNLRSDNSNKKGNNNYLKSQSKSIGDSALQQKIRLLAAENFRLQKKIGESGTSTALNSQQVSPYVSVKGHDETQFLRAQNQLLTEQASSLKDKITELQEKVQKDNINSQHYEGIIRQKNEEIQRINNLLEKIKGETFVTKERQEWLELEKNQQISKLREENIKISSTVSFMQAQLETIKDTCAQLRGQLSQRDQLVREISYKLNHSQNQRMVLLEKQEALKKQSELSLTFEAQIERMQSQQARFLLALQNAEHRNSQIQILNQNTRQELQEQLRQAEESLNKLKAKNQEAEAQLRVVSAQCSQLKAANKQLNDDLFRAKSMVEQERVRQWSESEQLINQLQAKNQNLQNKCALLVLEIERMRHQIEQNRESLLMSQQKHATSQEALTMVHEQKLAKTVEQYRAKLEEIQKQCRIQMDQLNMKFQMASQHNQFRIEDYTNKILDMTNTLKQQESTIMYLSADGQTLKLRVQEKELLIAKEKQINMELRVRIEDLQRTLQQQKTQKQRTRIVFQSDKAEQSQKINHFQAEVSRLKSSLQQMRQEHINTQKKTQQQLNSRDRQINSLTSEIHLKQSEIEKLRSQLFVTNSHLQDQKFNKTAEILKEERNANQRLNIYRKYALPSAKSGEFWASPEHDEIRFLESIFLYLKNSYEELIKCKVTLEDSEKEKEELIRTLTQAVEQCRNNERLIITMEDAHNSKVQKLGQKFETQYAQIFQKYEKYKKIVQKEKEKKQVQRQIIKKSEEFGDKIVRKCREIVEDVL